METLVDRYLAAVSDLLPAKHRKETVTEISSLIQDALDERSKAEQRPADDVMMAEVLSHFGSPEKIVAPYLPERYLIGPGLFPTFLFVLRIALPIIAVLSMIGFWVGASQTASMTLMELIANVVKSLGSAISAVIQVFGNVVLIFAILQWVLPDFKMKQKDQEWDPHSLKAISKPDKIKRGELIVDIFFSLVGLIVFTFYLDRIGIYNMSGSQWTFTPILTSAFKAYIPWLDLFWVLTIILDAFLLRRGSWSFGSRIFSILLNLFNIGIAVGLITHIPVLFTLQGALGLKGVEGILTSLLNQFLIIAFVIAILVSAAKIIQLSLQLLRSRTSSI